MVFYRTCRNIFHLGGTPVQIYQKSTQGSYAGSSTIRLKGNGSMNENTKKLLGVTATPLASIFGSGFLVIVPILNGAVGPYARLAMACVCGLAYAMGNVIRFNIRNSCAA